MDPEQNLLRGMLSSSWSSIPLWLIMSTGGGGCESQNCSVDLSEKNLSWSAAGLTKSHWLRVNSRNGESKQDQLFAQIFMSKHANQKWSFWFSLDCYHLIYDSNTWAYSIPVYTSLIFCLRLHIVIPVPVVLISMQLLLSFYCTCLWTN